MSGSPHEPSSRTLPDWVIDLSFAVPRPPRKSPPFTDGRFDAPALYHLEGLCAREGDLIGTNSALEADNSQEDLVSRSKKHCLCFLFRYREACFFEDTVVTMAVIISGSPSANFEAFPASSAYNMHVTALRTHDNGSCSSVPTAQASLR